MRGHSSLLLAASALLGLVTGGLGICCGGVVRAEGGPPRIVVLAVVDTLSSHHIAHLGYERATTPHLDRLAAEGVTFESAISSASYTVASIPSILTGRYPDRHGLSWYDRRLSQSEETLPELLAGRGYESLALVAVNNGGALRGTLQGFDQYIELWKGEGAEGRESFKHKGKDVHFPWADETLPHIRERLDTLGDDGRLFLYVHILEPHSPYTPPAGYVERFVDELCPEPVSELPVHQLRLEAMHEGEVGPWTRSYQRRYDAHIAFADDGLGAIFEELRQRGLYDEALIAVTADHGEIFNSHGWLGHGKQLYEEIVGVPIIVKPPRSMGIAPGRVSGLASNIDLLPTICELVDAAPGKRVLDGVSLAGVIRGDEDTGREEVFLRARRDVNLFALRTRRHKAILHLPTDSSADPREAQLELYDIVRDPMEQRDLAQDLPQLTDELRMRILAKLAELRTNGESESSSGGLSKAELRMLEVLGYTGIEAGDEH